MSTARKRRNATLIGATLAALAIGTLQPTAAASAAPMSQAKTSASRQSPVFGVEEGIARTVASSLLSQQWREQVREAVLKSGEVDLHALTGKAADTAGTGLKSAVAGADRRILSLKGLPARTGSMLRIRLGAQSMRPHLTAASAPWVAVAATDDHAKTLTAYDSQGRRHTIDTSKVPDRPLYIVDIDVAKAHRAGLAVLHEELVAKGLSKPQTRSGALNTTATAGWWATKVDAIEVRDDEEPWFKGAAEMFSLVTGFGLDGKARVDSVDMPYLDYDNTVYYPNQILVNWSNYKYNLADVVMMEDDDGTNYKALAQAITTALLTITDQGTYIPLVNAVLSAMPDSWFTDDPDYVESWYTLARNSSGRLNGARGNGWMTVEPYFVEQF
ncbi:DUF3103 family protein [Streptomyces sp. NPDC005209]|uniref:DUF3103 family protein n=1 Tax=Streptomyces sp. NPDC005209 TaxID=3156715 RepID=UPI0033BE035A